MATTVPQKTASTHRSALVRGTHQFDIVGYSVRKALGGVSSNSIRSAAFEAGGYTWALVCSFDDLGHLATISLELLSTDIATVVVAMASLRIDDPLGRWPAAVWRSDEANTFPRYKTSSSSSRSWKLSLPDAFQGKEARYVRDDQLTIHCAVDVLQEDSAAAETRNCFVSLVPPATISQDLHKLLLKESECMPDVTFVVERTEIQAHKLVLAMRSPVFAAEFLGPMEESTTRRVRIEDMSASTFRAMLRFIYTDEFPIKLSNHAARSRACKEKHAARRRAAMAPDLLVAADRYDLERLRLMCEKILAESVDAATVMPTLLLVRGRHSCRQLEASCIEYMASDPDVYAALKATEEYKELKESCCSFVLEVTDKVATHRVAGNSSSGSRRRPPEKSASTYYSSEVVQGTHDFRILNFRAVQRMHGAGQAISSGTFQVGGYDWKVKVYPSGYPSSEEEEGHIALFLELLTDPGPAGVSVYKSFEIHDPARKSPPAIRMGPNTHAKGEAWGVSKFITVESARSRYMGHDGSLTIHCEVAVTKQSSCAAISATISAGATIAVPPSNIAWHLEQLLLSEKSSDVRFLVQDSEIRAHALVIAARSPVLHEAVASTADHVVRIVDMKAATFKALLHFIYTDELPRDATAIMAGDMLAAACRFRLERMKAMCENLLCESISKDNALSALKLARRHHCQELEDYCIDFISLPHVAKEVMKTLSLDYLVSAGF